MNGFGRIFRISIFGESHGECIGVVMDGVPSGIKLSKEDFYSDLERRKSGKFGTTMRIEGDEPEIKSGVFNGFTTGAPILILFENNGNESSTYEKIKDIPRPGHGDFTAMKKYNGYNDYRGGGHFSGRLTLGLVAAGVVAKKIFPDIRIKTSISGNNNEIFKNRIEMARESGDSVGAVVECRVLGIDIGLGEPFFDSIESVLSHLIFSIPGIKGIEFGDGFKIAEKTGSEVNDLIIDKKGKTKTNYSGGINGGITNGNDLVFRIAVKPTSSISKPQQTFNFMTKKIERLEIEGNHDTCFAIRVPVIVEAVTAIVLSDFYLLHAKKKCK